MLPNGCGNGTVDSGEDCDDGNLASGDGCNSACSVERCGNGVLDEGETCDDGNIESDDGCSQACKLEGCGNGVLDEGETCDDDNTENGDGCSADCLSVEECGNGYLDIALGESCDDGNTESGDGCSADCVDENCGNGFVDVGERCDDGNTKNGDGCSADCRSKEQCGNGLLDFGVGEHCDDGNTKDGDGCSATCRRDLCGNGVVDPGESCDDGNSEDDDGCTTECLVDEGCGNGWVDPGEMCDPGSEASCNDSCTSDLTCGNGYFDSALESCDDSDESPFCDYDCTRVRCGDGIRNQAAGETCDDEIHCPDNLLAERGKDGKEIPCYCSAPAAMSGAVWGTNVYTDDSKVCRAAVHAGIIPIGGGALMVVVRPGRASYAASKRFGVSTYSWGSWPGSFEFRRVGRVPIALVAGGGHTCVLLDNDSVKCWGLNDSGQLGLRDTANRGDLPGDMGDALPTIDLGAGRTAHYLAAGDRHTCALLDNDDVKCWGHNYYGQLGLGDIASHGAQSGDMGDALSTVNLGAGRTAQALAAGYYHTCALLDDGDVKCWGENRSGQLGLGDIVGRGGQPGEMGDALLPVNLGPGRTAQALTAGAFHTCALLDNETVKCWGANGYGELGLGDTANRGDQPGEMGDALLPVNLGPGRTAQALTAGAFHTCALLDNETVKCWGGNGSGQLGLGDNADRGGQPGEMGDALLPVNLGPGRTAQALTAGFYHSCALLDNDSVKCWGDNDYGQLGLGDNNDRGDQPNEMGDALLPINLGEDRTTRAVAAGYVHTCALLDNETVKCWGENNSGQLGLGDINFRGYQPGQMGENLPPVDLGSASVSPASAE